jgi:hypothetical protein
MNNNRYKWILFLVVVLMISNIVLALCLFASYDTKEKVGKKRENPSLAIYKEIGLSTVQVDTFKARKELYFKNMKPLWQEMKVLKDSLYKQMDKSPTDSSINSLISLISEKSKEADIQMYQHFYEMRKFCTTEQQVIYDTIIPKLLNRGGRGNRR